MQPVLLAAAVAAGSMLAPAAQAAVSGAAPAVNCQRDPVRGDVCGLYHDIFGSASAIGSQSFSSGTGIVYGPVFTYQGRASGGAGAATYAGSQADAFATFGMLRSSSSASAGTGGEWLGPHAGGVVNTTVGFSDTINVTSASRAGQSGTVVATFSVDGGLNASTTGFSSRSTAAVQVTARGESFRQMVSSDSAVPSASGQVPELITMRIPVTFSPTFFQPFSVTLATSASASALNVFNSPRTAQAESDYGSTLLWTGVSSVLDANGQLVPDWVMRSGSGFDYSRSFVSQVPEPATVALMLAGLGVVGAAAKRRRAISASGAARPADA
jgi:hypothetical protein